MHKENSSFKSDQYPTQRYDYDGIAGMWLLIPSKFHILALALLIPVILWVLPNIHFKGSFHYFLLDYRYYIAAFIAIFFISSAILSIIKAKQVTLKIRPLSHIKPQVSEKKPATQNRDRTTTVKTAPKINNVKQNPSVNSPSKPQITIKKSERVSVTNTDFKGEHSDNGPTSQKKVALQKELSNSIVKKPTPQKTTNKANITAKNDPSNTKNKTTQASGSVKAKDEAVIKAPKKRTSKKKETAKTSSSKKTTKTALTKKEKQLELDL